MSRQKYRHEYRKAGRVCAEAKTSTNVRTKDGKGDILLVKEKTGKRNIVLFMEKRKKK